MTGVLRAEIQMQHCAALSARLKWLVILLPFTFLCGCRAWIPDRVDVPAESNGVPFELRWNHPIVEVYVNGEGPYHFGLDTGAPGTIVDQ